MKSTKKSLLLSALSLLLCFAMLIGTTFAWFTDSVTSGVNKIVAGNLDIEVSYKPDSSSDWVSIQDATSLFTENLWEPGHTEYVTLKIENKGTLALKYKMLVSPVSENGGVNMAGQSFKLSDYLMFGTTAASTAAPSYTRDTARAAVTATATGLNQANLSPTGEMLAGADAQYITLVVYMPEDVGNEANYLTGTAAPTIDLGITVLATQKEAESDSFDNTYDAGAASIGAYNVGPVYNYFPQVVASQSVAASGDTTITASGKLNKDDTTDTTLATVVVPADAVDTGVSALTLKVTPQAPTPGTTAAAGLFAEISDANREIANFDVKVEGVKDGNTADITVHLFVGTGLSNVKVYHNGVLMAGTAYNASTGYVTFTTTSFSDYTVAYDVAAAAIGTKTYGTLALAVDAAKNGDTITLLKNSAGNGIKVAENRNFTVNFNGFIYDIDGTTVGSTGTETNGFQLLKDSTITFKNGTLTSSQAKILIQNYCNLTLDNMTLDGTNLNDTIPCTLSNNCGNVAIKNSTITAKSGGVAFDVYGGFGNYGDVTVTVTGNSVINGKIEVARSTGTNNKNTLNINGGTINGDLAVTPNEKTVVTITGGTFSNDPSAYLAENKVAYKDNSGRYVIGEAPTENNGVYEISNAGQLIWFAKQVNAGAISAKTAKLVNDIDLNNVEWTQIDGAAKNITFDGNNHTIRNLKVSTGHDAGFFKTGSGCTIKNLTIDGASVTGIGRIAVICGHGMCVKVENCTVKNATVTAVVTNNDDGDKAGAIVGYLSGEPNASVKSCTVENCQIKGYRDVGALVGYAGGTSEVSNNTATNCTVTCDMTNNYKDYTTVDQFDVHDLVGEKVTSAKVENNTATNVTVK